MGSGAVRPLRKKILQESTRCLLALGEFYPAQKGVFVHILVVGVSMTLGVVSTGLAGVSHVPFGTTSDGTPVTLYALENSQGMRAQVATYGGIVVSLTARDREGRLADIVLGYDTLEPYLKRSPYFGAVIGRYANRIAQARFQLDGVSYQLAMNNGPNSLHGGNRGFDKVVWKVLSARAKPNGPELKLTYLSKDGEEGYPGNLLVRATYSLTNENTLKVEFEATTDKPTVVNLTQHSYFNLRGHGDVLGHVVQINASRFTPVNDTLIPIAIRGVTGTPFDFRKPTAIGARIGENDEQLRIAKGYDQNWILDRLHRGVILAATVYEPSTGRVLDVLTDQPGLQFYTGNFLDDTLVGKGGWKYQVHDAFCLEPQHFPDSPNHSGFPSTVLRPGETYRSTIVYRFRVQG